MADRKVSSLTVMAAGDLDPVNDRLLVSDTSASASKAMAPAEMIRASLPYISTFWDFTTGSLLPTVSFTRASTGWRFNSSGVLVPETTDVARFQYDPATLTPRGLMIEEARTELIVQSEDGSTGWTLARASIMPNTAVAPDGTTTMDSLIEDGTASQTHAMSRQFVHLAATPYVYSCVAKASTRSWLMLSFSSAAFGSTLRAWFDVANGVVGTVSPGVSAFIQSLGGGLYRCVAIAMSTGGGNASWGLSLAPGDTVQTYSGDGTSGLYVWGMQAQVGDAAGSYIKTTESQVARAADVALITNSQTLADQCWIVKGRTPRKLAGGAVNVAFQVDDGSGNNRRTLRYGTDGRLHAIATVGGADQCDLDLGSAANDTDFAVAIRWANNNFAASLNGGAIVTDTSGSNPLGLTTARVGRGSAGNYWNSTIRTIETRRTASDAELPLLAA